MSSSQESKEYELPASALRPEIRLEEGSFTTTETIRSSTYVIQQNRAFQALQLGVEAQYNSFHVFVVGPPATGRRTLTRKFVEQFAHTRPTPPDTCYVFNFEEPDNPIFFLLPPGRGYHLKQEMEHLRRILRDEVPKVFESSEYEDFRRSIQQELNRLQQQKYEEMQSQAKEIGFTVLSTAEGFQPVPLQDGKPMTPEAFSELPESEHRELARREQDVILLIQQFLKDQRRIQRDLARRLREHERSMVQKALQPFFTQICEDFRGEISVIEWCRSAYKDITENLREIFEAIKSLREQGGNAPSYLDRYDVNILVTHNREGAPVVYETNPTYYNLFGRIERRPVNGTFITDFTLIKPGALHRANGGFLILEALEVLKYPMVWDTLKRSLEKRELLIEDYGQQLSPVPVATLRPQPIPLDVRVILIGSPWVYQLLYTLDESFSKVFKIKAEFQSSMDLNEETIGDVIRYAARVCHEENMLHIDRGAMEEILIYSSRLAGDAGELSSRFGVIADVIREAHYWAEQEQKKYIDREALLQALEARRYRDNLMEERVQKLIERDVLMIETQGFEVGRLNGLAVYQVGGYSFGRPNLITATVAVGQEGIINIERQVKLSGPIHDKGVLIFSGYLRSMFARNKPLSLSASLTFEQGYENIEGDSASLAELIVLLSAIGEVPLNQGIAVTGSVNQHGRVQPVGGINEKIEGFFDVCAARGLTGGQGVVIPKSNVRHLCLHQRVIHAVKEGKFHIWAVSRVEEAMELLTTMPAGTWDEQMQQWKPENSIFFKVDYRLWELGKARKLFDKMEKQGPHPEEEVTS